MDLYLEKMKPNLESRVKRSDGEQQLFDLPLAGLGGLVLDVFLLGVAEREGGQYSIAKHIRPPGVEEKREEPFLVRRAL